MNSRPILSAALIMVLSATLWSCEDSKGTSKKVSSDPPIYNTHESIIDPSDLKREFGDENFNTINVNLSYPDAKAPVDVSYIDISGLDFGEKLPVCNRAENADAYYTELFSYNGQLLYDYSGCVDKPVKGYATGCYIEEENCFIDVSYPNMVGDVYDWSLFSYDMDSGALEEVYSWSSDSTGIRCDVRFFTGRYVLFSAMDSGNHNATAVYKLDIYDHELTEAYKFEEKEKGDYAALYNNGTGDVCLDVSNNIASDSTVMYMFDTDSGEFVRWEDRDVPENTVMTAISGKYGRMQSYLIRPEGQRHLEMDNKYYNVELTVSSGFIVYADKERFIIRSGNKLHTYDIEKREHYISDVTDMGGECAYCNGMIYIGNRNSNFTMPVYCIMPDLGLVYPVCDKGLYTNICGSGNSVYFTGREDVQWEMKSIDGSVDGVFTYSTVTKLYKVT